jgi:ribosomal protein S18 acetylase RimI-like enzyme
MPRVDVIRSYLELRDVAELRPARVPSLLPTLERRHPIAVEDYLAIYTLVGERWHWRDRHALDPRLLQAHLDSPTIEVWVARSDDAIVGFVELEARADDVTEIMYFGLAPAFLGRGLGGWLLTRAVEIAVAGGARRIILTTCTLDGQYALPNYLARGFRIMRDETYPMDLPGDP